MPCRARRTAGPSLRPPWTIACSSPARRVRAAIIPRRTAPISPEWPRRTKQSPLVANGRRDTESAPARDRARSHFDAICSLSRDEMPSPAVSSRGKCHQRALIALGSSDHAIVLACGPVEDATIIPTGIFVIPLPSPTRRLIGVAILPAAGRTRGRNVVVGGSIPGPARPLVGITVLPGPPRACRRNLVVDGPVAAPARCLVDIALLPAGRTTDSRHVASGALVIRRVPRGRASALARGLGTFLLTARPSRVGALGIGGCGSCYLPSGLRSPRRRGGAPTHG